ncbi:TPA: YcgL domain-containing protein [Vibrio parahaemolyticus]|nr:YcgL domain-containing protein [Vibrio parahaemolyticus]
MKVDIYQMMGEEPHVIIVKSGTPIDTTVPKSVYADLTKWALVRHMNLSPSTTLVGTTASEVIDKIKENGYFSSLVASKNSTTSSFGAGIGAGILAASLGLTPVVSAIAGLVAGLLVASNSKEK